AILDEHGSFLMGLIEERADITLSEMVDRLESERSLRVDPSTIWYFLDRNDITAVSPLFGPPGVRFSGFLSQ
ncbi:MAG TPA: hypothetical protein DCS30_20010, partial [Rhizobiales bacterium]|nr:hypothetical protein [Hyphomicrobiales bacterium]